ncbi:TetR/AcrR family transcriptional regulator [Rhodococcus koreensis]|uniref:TetR/AcrR family transcriptional regulator n=1 Tax=Rhodococcus koreensis TaxID=99653 RepID=UPI0036DC1417
MNSRVPEGSVAEEKGTSSPLSSPTQISTGFVESAASLFREQGYAACTTRDLASALGIQKSTLYHYIDRKEDLLYEICRQSLAELTGAVQATLETVDSSTAVRAVIATHLSIVLAKKDMFSVTLMETRSLTGARREKILEARLRYRNIIGEVVREGQLNGELRNDIESTYLSMALFDHLNWILFSHSLEGNHVPENIAEHYTRIYLEGAAAKPSDGN